MIFVFNLLVWVRVVYINFIFLGHLEHRKQFTQSGGWLVTENSVTWWPYLASWMKIKTGLSVAILNFLQPLLKHCKS